MQTFPVPSLIPNDLHLFLCRIAEKGLEAESPALDAFVAEQDPLLLDPNDLRSERVNSGGIIE